MWNKFIEKAMCVFAIVMVGKRYSQVLELLLRYKTTQFLRTYPYTVCKSTVYISLNVLTYECWVNKIYLLSFKEFRYVLITMEILFSLIT